MKHLKYINWLFFAVLCTGFQSTAQQLDSIFHFPSPAGNSVEAVITDKEGNIYVAGYAEDTVWVSNKYWIESPYTAKSLYLTSYDKNGNERFTNFYYTKIYGPVTLKTDKENNIYLSAFYSGTMFIDGVGSAEKITAGSGDQVFIIQMNTMGKFSWYISTAGSSAKTNIEFYDFQCVDGNTIYWTISCKGDLSMKSSTNKFQTFSNLGDKNLNRYMALCMRSDVDGSKVAYPVAKIGNSDAIFNGYGLVVKGNSIVFSGSLSGTVDFDPYSGKQELTGSSSNIFYCLDTLFQYKWAKKSSLHQLSHLVLDANDKVRAYGTYGGVGSARLEVSSLDLNGNIGNEYYQSFSSGIIELTQVTSDRGGNVFLCGNFEGSGDFDPTAGTKPAGSSTRAPFLVKYNSKDSGLWFIKGTGSNTYRNKINGIHLDESNNLYAVGSYTRYFTYSGSTSVTVPFTTFQYGYLSHLKECKGLQPTISPSDTTICKGTSLNLSIGNVSQVLWLDDNSTNITRNVSPTTLSRFTAEVNDGKGCYATVYSNVSVQDLPTPTIQRVGTKDEVEVLGNWATMQWYLDQQKQNGETQSTFIPDQMGDIYCEVSDDIGCIGKSNPLSFTLSLADTDFAKYVLFHSNGLSNLSSQDLKITVYDVTGKQLRNKTLTGLESIQWQDLPSGVYLFSIELEDGLVYFSKQFMR